MSLRVPGLISAKTWLEAVWDGSVLVLARVSSPSWCDDGVSWGWGKPRGHDGARGELDS